MKEECKRCGMIEYDTIIGVCQHCYKGEETWRNNVVSCPKCKQLGLNTILGVCCLCNNKISYIDFAEKQIEPEEDKKEAVDHPKHYGGDNVYETIKVIEAWELDFHLGNVVKYISRAGKKLDAVEDLKKAKWYLERKISLLEGKV